MDFLLSGVCIHHRERGRNNTEGFKLILPFLNMSFLHLCHFQVEINSSSVYDLDNIHPRSPEI